MPSSGSDKRKRVVLLIDEDPAAGRAVHSSLNGSGYGVLTSTRHVEGLRLAARQKPDLILIEAQFKDADGMELARQLLGAPETRGTALAVIASEDSVQARFRALQLGAVGYFTKPLEQRALVQRVASIFDGTVPRPADPVTGPAVERLLELLSQLEEDAGSGLIELRSAGQSARIAFSFGEVQLAECGPLRGDAALDAIAAQGDWEIRFTEGAVPVEEDAAAGPERRDSLAEEDADQPTPPRPVSKRPPSRTRPPLDQTEPDASRPVRHVSSSLVTTVADEQLAKPWPARSGGSPALAPEPELNTGLSGPDDERTVVDQGGQRFAELAAALAREGLIPPPGAELPASAPAPVQRGELSFEVGDSPESFPDAAAPESVFPELSRGEPLEEGLGYDEDLPTDMSFRPPIRTSSSLEKSLFGDLVEAVVPVPVEAVVPVPVEAAVPPSRDASSEPDSGAPAAAPSRESLTRWLAAMGQPPLLLVVPPAKIRGLLQRAAEELGFSVLSVTSGLDAYNLALQRRPVAVLSDVRGKELDGRELLAALRSDFHVRETPFIVVASNLLASQVETAGADAITPIMKGLASALGPAVALHQRLERGEQNLSGRVEPLGIAHLLRALGAAGRSGQLQLRMGSSRRAEVVFAGGEVCAMSMLADEEPLAVGPLALFQIVGYEWQEYSFSSDKGHGAQVRLGDRSSLLETACQQNNLLLARIYQQGVRIEDVSVDSALLDIFLTRLPAGSSDLLVRLVEGEKAAELAEKGVATPGLLKSVLHDLRRKAILRASSLRPVHLEPKPGQASLPQAPPRWTRWLIIVAAGFATVLAAAGGYLVYRRVTLSRAPAARALRRLDGSPLAPAIPPRRIDAGAPSGPRDGSAATDSRKGSSSQGE